MRAEGPTVWRVCRALLGHIDAEDAWSETFLAALRAYPRLAADSNVRGWLVTIAHRKSLDLLRARQRSALPDPAPPERPALERRDRHEFIELWQALEALPVRQRHAVVYRHLAELPYDELAALLDSSPAAARRSVADGMAKLRRAPHLRRASPADEPDRNRPACQTTATEPPPPRRPR